MDQTDAHLKINSQSLPERCEICHQQDCFDAVANVCTRCQKKEDAKSIQKVYMRNNNFFVLRGKLTQSQKTMLEILGGICILLVWWILPTFGFIQPSILPPPHKVLFSFSDLYTKDDLILHAVRSILLNSMGYIEAIAIALPLGFIVGLSPIVRGMFERYIAVLRYVPLTAAIGLFIAWFGIETGMKVQFLAFGIFVYLLPVVVQRVDDMPQVDVDMMKTLGATRLQTIRHTFIPHVISKVWDDIIVLVAISWTYIIIAEMMNMSGGGLGALAYVASRQSRTDKIFAVLITIIVIGFLQDKILKGLDRIFFPHKYA